MISKIRIGFSAASYMFILFGAIQIAFAQEPRFIHYSVPEGLPRFDVLTSSGSGYIVAGAVVVDESDLDYHNASPLLNR